jgi:aldose 1-epimerase
MALLELSAGDYALTIAPEIGGSLRSFTWRGEPLLRTATGPSVLDAACFPLVPFSNRIAHGRFEWEGQQVQLSPNFPGFDHPHPLHGFGWTSAWEVLRSDGSSAELEHRYPGGEWPWPYVARQSVRLTPEGLVLSLSVTNLGDSAMPAGLGFHPYFPRHERTVLAVQHKGEWQNDPDCLPQALIERDAPCDWWQGKPVATRMVDTVYTDRAGPITIAWQDRQMGLTIECSPALAHTAIFVPAGADWFCVEPVSHPTNALNLGQASGGMHVLQPGDTYSAQVRFAAHA